MLALFTSPVLPALLVGMQQAADHHDDELRSRFGFGGFEVYELAEGVRTLKTGDFDGDGRDDLTWINDQRSRVDVLLRLDPSEPDFVSPEVELDEPNSLAFDGRFRLVTLFEERRVVSLDTGDLDGDGREEILYTLDDGTVRSARLPVAAESDAEPERSGRRFDELRNAPPLLRVCDLDGDGRADVLAVAQGKILQLDLHGVSKGAEATRGEPRTLDHFEGALQGLDAKDVDGDGRPDLITLHGSSERPVRIRLGLPGGGFGPRHVFELPPIEGARTEDVDGDGRAEIVAVFLRSGRLALYRLEVDPEEGLVLVHDSFAAQAGREHPTYGCGDLDGDGVDDLVVARADEAAVTLFRGKRQSLVLESDTFASLVGVAHPRIADVDGDGAAELVVASGPERMLGVTRWPADGPPEFPELVPIDGEPAAFDLADVNADGFADAIVLLTRGEGRKREYALAVHDGSPEGLTSEPSRSQVLEELSKVPSALRATDLDGDGRVDLVVFFPGEREAPLLFVQDDEGFQTDRRGREVPGLGVLEGVAPAGVSSAVEGGVLVAAGTFARRFSVRLVGGSELVPEIHEQVNASSPDASFAACVEADLLDAAGPELVVFDSTRQELVVLARDATGERSEVDRLYAGPVGARGLLPADVDGDGRVDVLALGDAGFGVLTRAVGRPRLREDGAWQPPQAGRRLDRVALGDLDDDGRLDLAVTEVTKNAVSLLALGERRLRHALTFRVFEQRTFGAEAEGREPREIVSADFDADGKDDLALLVHDKLVVYLQE